MIAYSLRYHMIEYGEEDPTDYWFSIDAKNTDSAIRKLKRYIKCEVSVQDVKIIGYY